MLLGLYRIFVIFLNLPCQRSEVGSGSKMGNPRALYLKDGTTLATLADARAFVLNEPEHIQNETHGSVPRN
jgi:hypothetical protein